jgi:hypothetical protein
MAVSSFPDVSAVPGVVVDDAVDHWCNRKMPSCALRADPSGMTADEAGMKISVASCHKRECPFVVWVTNSDEPIRERRPPWTPASTSSRTQPP